LERSRNGGGETGEKLKNPQNLWENQGKLASVTEVPDFAAMTARFTMPQQNLPIFPLFIPARRQILTYVILKAGSYPPS
jgi:hypothetical protein